MEKLREREVEWSVGNRKNVLFLFFILFAY